MDWQARLTANRETDGRSTSLADLLALADQVKYFDWISDERNPIVSVTLPPGARLVAFKHQYISTDGEEFTIYVLGWEIVDRELTIAFLQPDGLVEIASDREFVTTFERKFRKVGV